MDIKKTFGTNMRFFRKKAGLTQEALAEKLGVTAKHLGAVEAGLNFVSAEFIENASRIFGISAASLFYCEEEKCGSDSLLDKIDSLIQTELENAKTNLRAMIRQS